MSAPTAPAPLRFRIHLAHCPDSSFWILLVRQQAACGSSQQAEFRFPTRSQACQMAIQLAFTHRLPAKPAKRPKRGLSVPDQFLANQCDLNPT